MIWRFSESRDGTSMDEALRIVSVNIPGMTARPTVLSMTPWRTNKRHKRSVDFCSSPLRGVQCITGLRLIPAGVQFLNSDGIVMTVSKI